MVQGASVVVYWHSCSTQISNWWFAGINTVVQVLKSGELVCLQVPTQVPATSQVSALILTNMLRFLWCLPCMHWPVYLCTPGFFSSRTSESSEAWITCNQFFCPKETPPRLRLSGCGNTCSVHVFECTCIFLWVIALLLVQVNEKAAANDQESWVSLHLEAKEERSEFGLAFDYTSDVLKRGSGYISCS